MRSWRSRQQNAATATDAPARMVVAEPRYHLETQYYSYSSDKGVGRTETYSTYMYCELEVALYLTMIPSTLYTAANIRGWVNPRMRADCSHSQVLLAIKERRQ